MMVGQNITFGLEMHGVPKPERDARAAEVAKLLQIDHLLDREPGQLSRGQRQRVAMGRALGAEPGRVPVRRAAVEPDAKLRVDMRTEIKTLHQKLKTTIVYVTHDQIEAMTLSSRIAVMNKATSSSWARPRKSTIPRQCLRGDLHGQPGHERHAHAGHDRDGVPHASHHRGGRRGTLVAIHARPIWRGGTARDLPWHPAGSDNRC